MPYVLVVEDDVQTRWMLATALQRRDMEVDTAETAREAISLLDRTPKRYGCVLLDLGLPQTTGISVAEHIRATGSKTPVIVISGEPDLVEQIKSRRLDDVVRAVHMKPVHLDELVASIANCMRPIIPPPAEGERPRV